MPDGYPFKPGQRLNAEQLNKAFEDATHIARAVTSVAGKIGDVILTHYDIADWSQATSAFINSSPGGITAALGYVPYDAANPMEYQTPIQVDARITGFASNSIPLVNSPTPLPGTSNNYARHDHIHPTDQTRYSITNPANYQTDVQVSLSITNAMTANQGNATPLMNGMATPGTAPASSRQDHVHPTDTSRYAASNPSNYQSDTQVAFAITNTAVPLTQKGQVNGVASLDGTGKVPTTQLPASATGTVNYRAAWNPVTNVPVLANGALAGGVLAPHGDYFVASVSGTSPSIDGLTTWNAGDWIVSNGATWERVQVATNPYLPLAGGNVTGQITGPAFAVGVNDVWTSAIEPGFVWSVRDGNGNIALAMTTTGELWAAAIPAPTTSTMPISQAYADTRYLTPAGGNISGPVNATGPVTSGGPLSFPANAVYSTPIEPGFVWSVRDGNGNIAVALDVAGIFLAYQLQVTQFTTGSITVTGPAIADTVTYNRDLINGSAGDWLSTYTYGELIFSDGLNISGGFLADGRLNIGIAQTIVTVVAGVDQASAPHVVQGIISIVSCPAGGGIQLRSQLGGVWFIQNNDPVNYANIWLPTDGAFVGNPVGQPVQLGPNSTTSIWQSGVHSYATRKDKTLEAENISYTDSLINNNAANPNDWIGGYLYDMTISDGTNISGGVLPDGRLQVNLALLTFSVVGGANLASATQLMPGVIDVRSCPPGGGVQAIPAKGGVWYVQNSTSGPFNFWPANGTQFGVSSIGSPVTLESGSAVIVWHVTNTKYGIMQAGSGGGGAGYVFTGTGFTNPRDLRDRVADTVNVNDLVAGIDPTGVKDNSNEIKAAHDLALAMGYRYLWFPARSKINAPFGGAVTPPMIYNVIFIGESCTINTYRKVIADPHAKSYVHPIDDVTPIMFEQFTSYVRNATPAAPARVVILGHSGVDANQRDGNGGGLTGMLAQKFQKAYGNRPIEMIDRSIGGTAWIDLARNGPPLNAYGNDSNNPMWWAQWYETNSPGNGYTRRWIEYALDLQPVHALFLCHGANDNKNFDVYALQAFLDEVRARFNPIPTIFSIADYGRKMQDSFTGNYATAESEDYCAGYQRTYWRRHGIGFFDFGRAIAATRDGQDQVNGELRNWLDGFAIADGGHNNQLVTTFPWTYPAVNITNTNFSVRFGPAGNMNAVFGTKKLLIQISSEPENLLILEQDVATNRLAYTVQSIASSNTLKYGRDPTWPAPTAPYNSIPRTVTNFNLAAAGTLSIELDFRDSLMFLSCTSKSGTQFTQPVLAIKQQVERYGGYFQPNMRWDTGASTVVTILQAASYIPDVYMPTMTDEEFLPAATLHINTTSMARLWVPCINAARFV